MLIGCSPILVVHTFVSIHLVLMAESRSHHSIFFSYRTFIIVVVVVSGILKFVRVVVVVVTSTRSGIGYGLHELR
jgi:hypothetical protein